MNGRRFCFDVETDGLIDQLTRIHCLVMRDLDTGETISVAGHEKSRMEEAVRLLNDADLRVAHNGIKFDEWALHKVFPWFIPNPSPDRIRDTMTMCQLLWPNIGLKDKYRVKKGVLPGRLIGSQSLEAWGYRLGRWKGEFAAIKERALREQYAAELRAKTMTSADITRLVWADWSEEMQAYCVTDVDVSTDLYQRACTQGVNYQRALDDEHAAAILCAKITANGFPFDTAGAANLYGTLSGIREKLADDLHDTFGTWVEAVAEITPKTSNKTSGAWGLRIWTDLAGNEVELPPDALSASGVLRSKYKGEFFPRFQGFPYTKIEYVTFNPSSRHHIADRLKTLYNWEPTAFTDTGDPKIDEEVIEGLDYPCAPLLKDWFLIQKRLGQLAEGKQAWLVKERFGHIHGSYNPLGAITRRSTHSDPNVGQVPGVKLDKNKHPIHGLDGGFGWECRSLFHAGTFTGGDKGTQAGTDASGLELRCLSHFMSRWDGGVYAQLLTSGADIHEVNAKAAGVDRATAKTFIYAFLYGSGDELLGGFVGGGKAAGKALREKFLKGLPALASLIDAVSATAKQRGFLLALDGAPLYVRHSHAVLNTLLQSAGALICKRWIVTIDRMLRERGLRHGWDGDYAILAWVHDELQISFRRPEDAAALEAISKEAMRETEAYFQFRCPLDTATKLGSSWAECH